MKIAYAFRRSVYYPYKGDPRGLPGREVRARLFPMISDIGFDGVELGVDMVGGADATESSVVELRRELEDYGAPCVSVRGGGGMTNPTGGKIGGTPNYMSPEQAGADEWESIREWTY